MTGASEPNPASAHRSAPGPEVRRLFEAAIDLPAPRRASLLDLECTDPRLRAEVEALLAAHDALERGESDGARFLAGLDPALAAAVVAEAGGPDARDSSELPGRIGRYDVIRSLGRGGMGVVALGRDPDLDRLAALKLLPRDVAADPDARDRFVVEARAASALDHPAIATVYEIGETDDGQLFIAMAYYGEETLRARLANGPLPVRDAVAIAIDVAEGLRAAHARGIVHRDIKPANLLLAPGGGVKIIDFGLVKLAGGAATHSQVRMGTAPYMSPEQTKGGTIDARTDIWSLGVVLYEMLTAARPFPQERMEALVYGIRHDTPPSPVELRPEVPEALATIVARCLKKAPERRFQSMDELLGVLRALPDRGRARRRAPRSRRIVAASATAVAAGAVVVVGTVLALRTERDIGATGPPQRSIAVLPFANVGDDPADAYLADGITEDLLSTLGQIGGLRVAARSSSLAFRGGGDAGQIARRLGVSHLLEGSVQRAGDRLRVSVRLADAAQGVQVWSRRYEREVSDLFLLEDEISRAVAAALRLKVLEPADPQVGPRRTADLAAHDLYLRGRHAWNRRTEEGFREAVAWFRAAVDRDSTYAAAWAGLSDAYRLLGTYGFLPGSEAFAEAEAAARRAVALAPRSGEAHASLPGSLQQRGLYRQAEEEFQRAIAVDPGHAHARHWHAFLLGTQGRIEEALREIARARALDPLNLPIRVTEARLQLHTGAAASAIASLEEGIRADSAYPWAWYVLAIAYSMEGRTADGLSAMQSGLERVPGEPRLTSGLAALRAGAGDTLAAVAILDRLRETRELESIAYALAVAFGALNQPDSAFAWLGRVPWNSEYLFSLRMDPLLEPLRADPRYRALGIELGLPAWP